MSVGQTVERLDRSWNGNSMASTRSQQDPIKQKIKNVIRRTQSAGKPVKDVMRAQDKNSKFSFNRQRMDFHTDPAKMSRAVGSYMGNSVSSKLNLV